MSLEEATVGGMLNPDGTLELDQKPNLPPGRVTVVVKVWRPRWGPAGGRPVLATDAGHVGRPENSRACPAKCRGSRGSAAADAGRLGKAARSHRAAYRQKARLARQSKEALPS